MAIAQHYSSEIGIKSWLLDVTTSPWIALFFASEDGVSGDIGVVEYIDRSEWIGFSDDNKNALGSLRYVSSDAPRIKNQFGFFIEAPHPELYNQLSNRRLCFRQHDGLVFEDATLSPAITREHIYPQRDPILAHIHASDLRSVLAHPAKPLAWEPPTSTLDAPDEDTFLGLVLPWATEVKQENFLPLWRQICQVHATLTARKEDLPEYILSLHQLRRAFKRASAIISLVRQRYREIAGWFEECVESLYAGSLGTDAQRRTFLECVSQADAELASSAERALQNYWSGRPLR